VFHGKADPLTIFVQHANSQHQGVLNAVFLSIHIQSIIRRVAQIMTEM